MRSLSRGQPMLAGGSGGGMEPKWSKMRNKIRTIRQTNFYTITASVYTKMLRSQSIMHKKTSFNPGQRRSADAAIITFCDTPTLYSYR
jgi:hypothetical protein